MRAESADTRGMQDKEQQSVIKSQAQLDQAWAAAEILLPNIVDIAERGFGPHTTVSDLALAKMCVQLVSWELSLRVLQRDYFVKATVYDFKPEDGERVVKIKTKDGENKFFVPDNAISYENDEDEVAETYLGYVRVHAYKLPGGFTAVVLPNKETIIVPESEVITQ